MLFGLPWFAVVAIVAIAGGLFYSYKEQELRFEEKRLGGTRELNELRKIVHNLKTRIVNLEAIVTSEKSVKKETANPLSSIEIDGEIDEQNGDNPSHINKKKTNS